jgi:hypothetical protein
LTTISSTDPKKTTLHIYPLSCLFKQNATRWENILKDLESDREAMRSMYAPVRIAANKETREPGKGEPLLEHMLSRMKSTPQLDAIKKYSRAAFKIYCDKIRPRISSLDDDLITGFVRNVSFSFGGITLEGAFHAKVTLKSGKVKYLYIHPSEWPLEQETAFIELLAIMAESAYGASRGEVWFVDLRSGEIKKPRKCFTDLRKELEATIRHYQRVKRY